MEKIHQRAHDGLNIDWPKRLKIPGKQRYARLVPLERTKRPLYVSQNGQGYSCRALKDAETHEIVGFELRAIKDHWNSNNPKRLPHTHNYYRHFRNFNHILVHHAVLLAWVGPCPEGCQCDHLNGINTDNRLCNLQWVTNAENIKRGYTLKRLRRLHEEFPKLYKDPAKMTRKELLNLFTQE